MAFQESGIKLSVSGLSQFINDISRANQVASSFGSGAKAFTLGSGDPFAGLAASADRSIGTVQAKFGGLNSFMAGIFAGAGSLLATSLINGAVTAASAIPNLIKTAFSEAIDLQQAAADAFAISQPTAEQQVQLTNLAESVALNPNLQVSQKGALEAIDAALKANISAQQIVNDGVIEAIVSQQNALGGTFDDNARLIAKQLNDQIGVADQLSAQQLANQNVGTFRAGQFRQINDLLLAQAASGGALKSLGVSQQQFNEFLAIAGTVSSGGSDAGTSVKSFINAATNASKEQRKAQDALNFNIESSTGEFNDAIVLSQQLSEARINGIDAIITSGGGTKEQQAELKRLNRALVSNLNSASNLAQGITGANLSDEKRAAKIEQANKQAQAAKAQFDEMLGTVPGLQRTAVKIKQSETEFAGLLFQAFGTDGGRFAAALAGLSEEEAKRVQEIITSADALEVAGVKTNTVKAKLEAIGDIFTANITKIAKPSLGPLKDALSAVASLGGSVAPAFDLVGSAIFRVISGPLSGFTRVIGNLKTNIDNFASGFSNSIRLSDILSIDPSGFDVALTRDIFGGQKLKLTFGDIFSLDLTSNKFDLKIGDIINFSGSSGEDGFKLNLNDYFIVDTTGEKVRVNIGDLVSFDTGSLGQNFFARLQIGNLISTFIKQAGRVSLSIGDLIDFNTSIDSLGQTLTQLRIGERVASIFTSGGKVTVALDKLFFFDFNPSNAFGFATLNFSAFGRNLVDAFYRDGKIQIDVGKLLSVGGSFSPSGVFTLSLNGSNFVLDLGAIRSFVASVPGKIQDAVSLAFTNPGQFLVDVSTYLAGLGTAIQTSVTGFFTAVPAWVIDVSTYLAGLGTTLQTSVTNFFTSPPAWVVDASTYLSGLSTAIQSSINAGLGIAQTWLVDAATFVSGIKTSVQSEINRQLSTPGTFANTAQNAVTGVTDGTSQAASNAIVGIASFITGIKTSIATSLQNAFSVDTLFEFQLDARGIASKAGQLIGRFLGNAISGAVDFISLDSFTNFGASFGRFMHTGLLKALAGATVVLGTISNTVADVFLNFFGGIGEGFGGTKAAAKLFAAATSLSNGFVTAIENESKALGEKINKPIQDAIGTAFNGFISATQGFADSLIGIANQIIGILNALNPLGQLAQIETFAGQNARLQSSLTSNASRQAADNASSVVPVAPQPLSSGPALGSLTQFGQPSTAPLQAAINKAAASYDAMSAAALTNSKSVIGAKAPKYDVLSSAINTTASNLKAPTSKPPSYNPLSSAISGASSKLGATGTPPSYNPLSSAISTGASRISSQPNPPSYNPLTGAINSASSKLNSMGQPTQFGPLTSAAASAAAKLAGFTVPTIPPFPGWGALVDAPSQPSTGGGTPSGNTGGGNGAKQNSFDTNKLPTIPLPQTGFDDTRIIAQMVSSTNLLVKAIEDTFSSGGKSDNRKFQTNVFAVGSSVNSSALLSSVLQSDELKRLINAAIKGNIAPSGASSPSTGGDISPIDFPGRGNPFPFAASTTSASTTVQKSNFTNSKGDNQTIKAIIATPPSITNNYYNTTKNYNLSVQTIQSDASVIEQFGYMERLAASV